MSASRTKTYSDGHGHGHGGSEFRGLTRSPYTSLDAIGNFLTQNIPRKKKKIS